MFFQRPAAEPDEESRPDLPPWVGPPKAQLGAVVATEMVLARSANVAVALPQVTVYPTGCLFTVEVVIRKAQLPSDDWLDLAMSATQAAGPSQKWERVLRLGLRYPDGTTVTNLDSPTGRRQDDGETPVGPLLSWTPYGSGGTWNHHTSEVGMWLWPLPPAQPLTFAVEWPLGGIELTTTELDGAQLVAAAERSIGYWAD
ncbi:MAG TPA: hypothetical protein VGL06_16970 [Pseudonocardiaceae bacterium]